MGTKKKALQYLSHSGVDGRGGRIIPNRYLRSRFVIKQPSSLVTPKQGILRDDVPNAKAVVRCRDSTLASVLRHGVGAGFGLACTLCDPHQKN